MNRQEILNKLENDEDKLLIARIFDKIEFSIKRNSIEHTDFLDIRQRHLIERIMKNIKFNNFVIYGGYNEAERNILIIYPNKLEEIFKGEKFDFNTLVGIMRITLPNELKGIYSHRNYLGGIIKTGIKREKVGDIVTNINGADIIILKESEKYIYEGLKTLTRFHKARLDKIKIEELQIEKPKMQILNIIIPSMRIDSIVSEVIKTSRAKAVDIIKAERVFVNHELIFKSSKEIKTGDLITVRGKGRFKVGSILNNTKKGNLILEIEKYE